MAITNYINYRKKKFKNRNRFFHRAINSFTRQRARQTHHTHYTVIQVTALTQTRSQTDYKSRFTIFVLKAAHDSFM